VAGLLWQCLKVRCSQVRCSWFRWPWSFPLAAIRASSARWTLCSYSRALALSPLRWRLTSWYSRAAYVSSANRYAASNAVQLSHRSTADKRAAGFSGLPAIPPYAYLGGGGRKRSGESNSTRSRFSICAERSLSSASRIIIVSFSITNLTGR
jgi:hypothetical protein